MTIPPKSWTVLLWAASDNDLYPYEIQDLDKMERAGPGDRLHLLATVDHPNDHMERLELQKEGSIVRAAVPNGDMASPEALKDFLTWGIKNYPAEKYWLIISDHGDSWQGACEDEGSNNWMSLPGIQRALFEARQETGKKLDLLSFDCCYMAGVEVAHQLKDEARYLIASEEEMGYGGIDYENLLAEIPALDARETARRLVEISGKDPKDIQTFSAVDLEQMPAVTEAAAKLSKAIQEHPKSGAELRQLIQGTESFWEYNDAHHLADKLAQDPALKPAAEELKTAIEAAVVAERHADNHPNAHGLQIETQQLRRHPDRNPALQELSYRDTRFAQDTGWDKAIAKLRS